MPMLRCIDAELLAFTALYNVDNGAANSSTWVTLTAQLLQSIQLAELCLVDRHLLEQSR